MKWLWKKFMSLFKKPHSHEPKEEGKPIPVPEDATFGKLRIEINGMVNFSEKERVKFLSAVDIGNKILNSYEFKEMVFGGTYVENRGMTGKQIWELICTGKDLYNQESDNDIDVFVTMYHNFWTGTVGYTYPNTFKTWMNRKFFSSEPSILGNVIHESMHNFGFQHVNQNTRLESVPYKLGYFARDLAKQVMEGKELTPLKVGV